MSCLCTQTVKTSFLYREQKRLIQNLKGCDVTDWSLVVFLLLLTVVQSDEKYSLDHVIDIELFTQLLPGSEGAADLCHRVVIVINAV